MAETFFGFLPFSESGQVYTWGRADYGQLGRSCDRLCDHEPKPVPGVQGVCRIACGSEHNLALTGTVSVIFVTFTVV